MSHPTPLLPVKSPVPKDIEIAQSTEPLHISKIAEDLGLKTDEYDLYGPHKAKVGPAAAPDPNCGSMRAYCWCTHGWEWPLMWLDR